MRSFHVAPVNRLALGGGLGALAWLLSVAPAGAATLSAEAAVDFDVKVFAEGLAQPLDIAVLPDGRAIIAQRSGDLATVLPGNPDPVVDHIDVNSTHGEQGLLGVVADPNFATNQYVYFYASIGMDAGNRHQVVRYKFGQDSKLGTKTVVLDMGLRGPANHNGGALEIYQGNLYIGVGDTGANATPPSNRFGSCLNIANGKILRVSLAEATLGQPPADNPLVGQAMVTGCDSTGGDFGMRAPDKRIWAWGFRNPFRFGMDYATGKLWVGDVGEATREEITIAEAGQHYGYPFQEGTKDWGPALLANECMGMTPAKQCTPPVFDYPNVKNADNCVIGGRILDGCGWPAVWKSRYIFGDNGSGRLWTLDVNPQRNGVVPNSLKDFGKTNRFAGLRMGSDNALYILETSAGSVARITLKGSTATPNSCPGVNGGPGSNPGGGGQGGAPAGGASGAGGGTATGGNSATGGSGGSSATAGAGSDAGGSSSGGAPTNPSGGASTTAGSASTAAGAPSSGANAASRDSGGCSFQAGGGAGGSAFVLSILLGALGVGFARRRGVRS